jgi:SAM-dependent methyltransferase
MPDLPQYTLGDSDAELQRLVQLAAHEEEFVVDACRRAGVSRGAHAVDFGCGPSGALSALARVVGDEGTVTGIDASAHALERAEGLFAASHPQIRFLNADVREVDLALLGGVPVDLAYSRLMLLHQAEPDVVLARMGSVLREGGVLIAHEPSDQSVHAPSSEPAVPAMTRVWELVIGAAQMRGAKTDFGRRGRALLEAAGFHVFSQRAYYVHYPPAVGYGIPQVALRSLRVVLESNALASAIELDSLDAELEQAKQSADVQWVSSPLMIEWIARRGPLRPEHPNLSVGGSLVSP